MSESARVGRSSDELSSTFLYSAVAVLLLYRKVLGGVKK